MVGRPLIFQVEYSSGFSAIVGDGGVCVGVNWETASAARVDLEFDGLRVKFERGEEEREHDSEGRVMLEGGCYGG